MTTNTLLSLKNISLTINKTKILDNVSLDINEGNIITLIGPNGSGKSSLIKIAIDIQKPTSGTRWIKPNIKIGYVPQKMQVNSFIPLTVEKFLQLASKSITIAEINHFLSLTHTNYLLNYQLRELSGGELQRVLLSRAMINNPDLLILDEPMQGVDLYGQKELYKIIMQAHEDIASNVDKKRTVLMVSHDLHLVMAGTTKVVCLNKHICCSGTAHQVKRDPEYMRLFNEVSDSVAFYTHDHDHIHEPSGRVIAHKQKNK